MTRAKQSIRPGKTISSKQLQVNQTVQESTGLTVLHAKIILFDVVTLLTPSGRGIYTLITQKGGQDTSGVQTDKMFSQQIRSNL